MAVYLISVKTFAFFFVFRCSSFNKREGLSFFYNWCSLTTPYSNRGHIKVGDIYILYIFTKHKLTLSSTIYRDICQCRIVQQLMPQPIGMLTVAWQRTVNIHPIVERTYVTEFVYRLLPRNALAIHVTVCIFIYKPKRNLCSSAKAPRSKSKPGNKFNSLWY
jgi:hypothetical protein